MTIYKHLFIYSLCIFSTTTFSYYPDSANPDEAVGQMKTRIITIETHKQECLRFNPDLKIEIEDKFTQWEEIEKIYIEKAEFYTFELKKKNPELINQINKISEMILNQTKYTFDNVGEVGGEKLVNEYCLNFFEELINGSWKKRTPNLYKYLDQLPEIYD